RQEFTSVGATQSLEKKVKTFRIGSRMGRRLNRIAIGVLILGIVVFLGIATLTARTKLPGEEMTPAGIRRSTSTYVKMRDGVEIAVTVKLPADWKLGEKFPVLMRTTRYWREPQIGWTLRVLIALHFASLPEELEDRPAAYFNQRHFVVLAVDARGSGASGGNRPVEWSPAEVADMGEVAAWAAQQPWSNGRVGTFGISYDGNAAELAAAANQPAIRAVMPLYDNFDVLWAIQAGGVAQRSLLQEWSNVVAALDRNDVCGADEVSGWNCWRDRLLTPGVRPVDADGSGKHLAELVSQHHNFNVEKAVAKVEFADDRLGTFSLADISPSSLRRRIEASRVPMMVWVGWLDGGGGEDALTRYKNFSNPQLVVIGPLSHGGDFNVDPFASRHTPPEPTMEEQLRMEADFFDQTLRNDTTAAFESSIRYYTMGEGRWHTTRVWPPSGVSTERLYFGMRNTLTSEVPSAANASDSYTVDFTASTGKQSIWATGYGGGDVVYPDRADEDRKLLVYNSPPFETDVEITGSPVLSIEIASTTTDGAVHAYLEDVSPEGRVTYVDEGILRFMDRKEVDPKTLPYVPLGPAHSFLRKDAEPMTPGQPTRLRLALYPTSLLLRKGHRIRVAMAGADADVFQRYPAEGIPTWTVYRDAREASFIDLPVRTQTESTQK
ncbi:MAG TPA: CocE/NonD family hydrolase, partial [Candidatus Sulfotelmatobacter sp.]|nr:CocE/NonD family hydrolase [Candidatus Sulfotelmatobacter sp.]